MLKQIIAIAADHRGYKLKEFLKKELSKKDITVQDYGTSNAEDIVDTPDFAKKVAMAIQKGEAEKGILICGSGHGMDISVNRFSWIRGGLVDKENLAQMAREHDDINVLILPSDFIKEEAAEKCVEAFLKTPFDAVEKRIRRVKKMTDLGKESSL